MSGSWPATQIISQGIRETAAIPEGHITAWVGTSAVSLTCCVNLHASVSSPGTQAGKSRAVKGTAGVQQPGMGSDWIISLQMTSGVPNPLCTSVSSPLKQDGEFPGGPVVRTCDFH